MWYIVHVILLATPTDTTEWSLERLQAYIVHVKTINPITTELANQLALSCIISPSLHTFSVQSNVKILPVATTD